MTENLLDDHHALRGVFLFMFLQGHSSNEARRTMCEVLGADTIPRTTIKFWFKRFEEGNYNLEKTEPRKASSQYRRRYFNDTGGRAPGYFTGSIFDSPPST
ncbi:hypothetical protein L3Y34_001316 [Caenorhabditis briggsae]|uniref:Mos1 transposase HTH domain-containing protein n=1 Tax=Caenorhabditis briggsae TaxID=6238 RepID=A0AAE9DBW5_CAEBR|nr:hypothetical protein L3Y34_001316 [Caenorhabditis briggsae]